MTDDNPMHGIGYGRGDDSAEIAEAIRRLDPPKRSADEILSGLGPLPDAAPMIEEAWLRSLALDHCFSLADLKNSLAVARGPSWTLPEGLHVSREQFTMIVIVAEQRAIRLVDLCAEIHRLVKVFR